MLKKVCKLVKNVYLCVNQIKLKDMEAKEFMSIISPYLFLCGFDRETSKDVFLERMVSYYDTVNNERNKRCLAIFEAENFRVVQRFFGSRKIEML